MVESVIDFVLFRCDRTVPYHIKNDACFQKIFNIFTKPSHHMITYILATCIPGNEKEVIQKIKEIPNVVEVNGIMGKYDIFVKIQSGEVMKVDLTISKIRSVPHVTSTVSIPAIYGQGGTIDDEK